MLHSAKAKKGAGGNMAGKTAIDLLLHKYEIDKRSQGYSEDTIERVKTNMRCLCRDMHLENPAQFTTDIIKEWGNQLRQNGKSQSTVYAYFNSVRSFLKYLDDKSIVYPANRREVYCKPKYQRIEVLRSSDVLKISKAAKTYQIDVLIRLLYCSGMRLGEALALCPEDIRHDNTIYVTGKWAKSRYVMLWPDLAKELKELAPDGGYCFRLKKQPEKQLTRGSAHIEIKRAMVAAGYPNAYPHSLRHTFATEQLRGGASTNHVQRQLGHTQSKTTERYLHLITDDLLVAHEQFLPKL